MPLHANGWTIEEDEKLIELVQPHSYLYNVQDPSRKNILARESTWEEIAEFLSKPVEECKKRWRGLRDGYMRNKRLGTVHKARASIFEKLQFLVDETVLDGSKVMEMKPDHSSSSIIETEQQVITDNQEYYEITVVEDTHETKPPKLIKISPAEPSDSVQKKVRRNQGSRKKALPIQRTDIPPIKILPKPVIMNGPKLVRYIEDTKTPAQRSEVIDKLIERVLKENTNEIDVFFRSMAASVKKLQPNLIPKVKMEVCNVIAKYEMQSYEKGGSHF